MTNHSYSHIQKIQEIHLYICPVASIKDLLYTVSQKKNDNDVLCYNFNAHQPILIIFGRDIAE